MAWLVLTMSLVSEGVVVIARHPDGGVDDAGSGR